MIAIQWKCSRVTIVRRYISSITRIGHSRWMANNYTKLTEFKRTWKTWKYDPCLTNGKLGKLGRNLKYF